MKKVKCTHVGNYGNDEFPGPNPKLDDILTVTWEGDFDGIYSYQFAETGPDYAYSAWRYEEIKSKENE